ncbi:ABC transporter permease [Egicoccus halophilus]|uniref:ABC transporter permease n=1 Tax=Egicoccus halophilus TaxID=1670830 RepID=UPI001E534D5F|nr:iron ABC transporter permease [Egicoccus halophilus]
MAEIEELTPHDGIGSPKRGWRQRLFGRVTRGAGQHWSVPFLVLVAFIALLVIGPILIMLQISLQEGAFGASTGYGFEAWREVMANSRIRSSLLTTINISLTRQTIAMIVGVWLSWVIARTDLPYAKVLEYGFWVAVFLPGLTVTLSWIMVFDPFYGVANRALEALPFIQNGPFDIYSWWGIVWVHLVSGTLPVKVMLLTPAFRNLDAALEEASRSSGATSGQTMRHVVIPLVAPTLLVALVLGTIRSLEAFEIELILGTPRRIDVLSTEIYRLVRRSTPQYSTATVVGMISLVLMLPAVVFQRIYTARRGHATLTGKSTNVPRPLGKWKWPTFALIASMVFIMTIFPMAMVIMGTFMNIFGRFDATPTWTLDNWTTILNNRAFTGALWNSTVLSFGTAFVAMVIFSVIAYTVVRTQLKGRVFLDYMVWLPSMLPGIVISLGYLILFINVPFLRPMFGTMSILIVVAALGAMTLTTQMVKASLIQIGAELEEASRASGGNWFYTFRRVVLPLIAPTLAVVGVLAFSTAVKTTGHVALLSTSRNQPLSILQLNQMADFNLEAASVVGVFILIGTVGVALVARLLGFKARG